MGMMDKEVYKSGASGEKMPKGVLSSDTSGERKETVKGGVGMGMKDACGKDSQFNTGKTAGVCYTHKRNSSC